MKDAKSPASSSPAWRDPMIWRYTLLLGLPVGLLQAALNQGDHWWRHEVNGAIIAKSILSPVLSCSIAFTSAAISRDSRKFKSNDS
jgi:hypothetical protein